MRYKCCYCYQYLNTDTELENRVCTTCSTEIKKIGDDTFDWLMRIIQNQTEEAIRNHVDNYSHEWQGRY